MSKYLRDEFIRNISLNEQTIKKINVDISEIKNRVNTDLAEKYPQNQSKVLDEKILLANYIIRFDNKGFRLFDFKEVLKHYNDAHKIERLIFVLESPESIKRHKLFGKNIELHFDALDANNCYLSVQDDDKDWVDSSFYKLKERLNECKNLNFILQNRWIPFAVQIIGVFTGLFLSFWVAVRISPRLNIESAFAFTFIAALILFSNVWGILYGMILRCLNYYWPNITFKEKSGLHWLMKALISTIFVGFFLSVFSRIIAYIILWSKAILK